MIKLCYIPRSSLNTYNSSNMYAIIKKSFLLKDTRTVSIFTNSANLVGNVSNIVSTEIKQISKS